MLKQVKLATLNERNSTNNVGLDGDCAFRTPTSDVNNFKTPVNGKSCVNIEISDILKIFDKNPISNELVDEHFLQKDLSKVSSGSSLISNEKSQIVPCISLASDIKDNNGTSNFEYTSNNIIKESYGPKTMYDDDNHKSDTQYIIPDINLPSSDLDVTKIHRYEASNNCKTLDYEREKKLDSITNFYDYTNKRDPLLKNCFLTPINTRKGSHCRNRHGIGSDMSRSSGQSLIYGWAPLVSEFCLDSNIKGSDNYITGCFEDISIFDGNSTTNLSVNDLNPSSSSFGILSSFIVKDIKNFAQTEPEVLQPDNDKFLDNSNCFKDDGDHDSNHGCISLNFEEKFIFDREMISTKNNDFQQTDIINPDLNDVEKAQQNNQNSSIDEIKQYLTEDYSKNAPSCCNVDGRRNSILTNFFKDTLESNLQAKVISNDGLDIKNMFDKIEHNGSAIHSLCSRSDIKHLYGNSISDDHFNTSTEQRFKRYASSRRKSYNDSLKSDKFYSKTSKSNFTDNLASARSTSPISKFNRSRSINFVVNSKNNVIVKNNRIFEYPIGPENSKILKKIQENKIDSSIQTEAVDINFSKFESIFKRVSSNGCDDIESHLETKNLKQYKDSSNIDKINGSDLPSMDFEYSTHVPSIKLDDSIIIGENSSAMNERSYSPENIEILPIRNEEMDFIRSEFGKEPETILDSVGTDRIKSPYYIDFKSSTNDNYSFVSANDEKNDDVFYDKFEIDDENATSNQHDVNILNNYNSPNLIESISYNTNKSFIFYPESKMDSVETIAERESKYIEKKSDQLNKNDINLIKEYHTQFNKKNVDIGNNTQFNQNDINDKSNLNKIGRITATKSFSTIRKSKSDFLLENSKKLSPCIERQVERVKTNLDLIKKNKLIDKLRRNRTNFSKRQINLSQKSSFVLSAIQNNNIDSHADNSHVNLKERGEINSNDTRFATNEDADTNKSNLISSLKSRSLNSSTITVDNDNNGNKINSGCIINNVKTISRPNMHRNIFEWNEYPSNSKFIKKSNSPYRKLSSPSQTGPYKCNENIPHKEFFLPKSINEFDKSPNSFKNITGRDVLSSCHPYKFNEDIDSNASSSSSSFYAENNDGKNSNCTTDGRFVLRRQDNIGRTIFNAIDSSVDQFNSLNRPKMLLGNRTKPVSIGCVSSSSLKYPFTSSILPPKKSILRIASQIDNFGLQDLPNKNRDRPIRTDSSNDSIAVDGDQLSSGIDSATNFFNNETVKNLYHKEVEFFDKHCNQRENCVAGDLKSYCRLPILNMNAKICPLISSNTVADILNGKLNYLTSDTLIIDCRFPYEYQGGHIKSAINLYTEKSVKNYLLDNVAKFLANKNRDMPILIFHCEFSSKRGPKLARYLRNQDRLIHMNCYPKLYFPEIYILFGGYKAFYHQYPDLCVPREYVTMIDFRFVAQKLQYFRETNMSASDFAKPIKTKSERCLPVSTSAMNSKLLVSNENTCNISGSTDCKSDNILKLANSSSINNSRILKSTNMFNKNNSSVLRSVSYNSVDKDQFNLSNSNAKINNTTNDTNDENIRPKDSLENSHKLYSKPVNVENEIIQLKKPRNNLLFGKKKRLL